MVNEMQSSNETRKSYVTTLLLALFLGCFGAHRFYVGKVKTGVIQLVLTLLSPLGVTAIALGIWLLIDIVNLSLGKFTTESGAELDSYNKGCGLLVLAWIILSILMSGVVAVVLFLGGLA